MNTRRTAIVAVLAGIALTSVLSRPSVVHAADMPDVKALRPLMAQVEYTLKYDEGDAPSGSGWKLRCPNCGRFHVSSVDSDLVKQKRPMLAGGFLLTPTTVLIQDPQLHPRFIEEIAVRIGDKRIKARPASYCRHENGVFLELEEPAPGAATVQFDAEAPSPYFAVVYAPVDATWATHIQRLESGLTFTDDGRTLRDTPNGTLIISSTGTPVGATMTGKISADDSWKGSPLDWTAYPADEMEKMLANIRSIAAEGLLPVTLRYRSPKSNQSIFSMSWDDDESEETEAHVIGVLYGPTGLLVLADLAPKRTARLESIVATLPGGEKVKADYGWAMKEFGCFTATLQQPLDSAISIDSEPIESLRDELIVSLQIRQFAGTHKSYALHARIPGFELGHKGQIYPEVTQDETNLFLFRADGKLAAMPVSRRERVKSEDDYWYSDDPPVTPVRYVTAQLADKGKYADPDNVPLGEEKESRIAWLGVELQNLDEDLADANNVSEITKSGEIGAIVSFVYADSPASAAGIQVGDILFHVYSDLHYRPIPVRAAESYRFMIDFPWEELDNMPEELMSEMPEPWPSVDNALSRMLTSLGFGARYKLDLHRDGENRKIALQVIESPPHYNTAPRFQSESLGLTVRNTTYEVRRYFQLKADDPGVIVSKIQPGLKAAVGGLRPYEIITAINDQPIHNVDEFSASLNPPDGKLRMTVRRMTKSRVIVIRIDEAAEPATDKKQ